LGNCDGKAKRDEEKLKERRSAGRTVKWKLKDETERTRCTEQKLE